MAHSYANLCHRSTTASPPTLSVGDIKALLFVLPGYLNAAPYEEDATALLPYMQQLRRELSMKTGPPRLCPGLEDFSW